jgi:hypothetical protein
VQEPPDAGAQARVEQRLGAQHVGGDERPAPRIERSTCDSAAKWTTASWPGISSSTSSASQMSP